MTDTKEQISAFLECCESFKKCKFIMATTKIKDILKHIVNSPELYGLFETVTKNFDYPAAKAECLKSGSNGFLQSCKVVLPQTLGQRLAFIFCLLVEFDRDSLNFTEFLNRYFSEDGSYYSSYQAFCSQIIGALQTAVSQVFAEELAAPTPAQQTAASLNAFRAELVSVLKQGIAEEAQFIMGSTLSDADKEGGLKILSCLAEAIMTGNKELIGALNCGYNNYVLYHGCVSEGTASLIQAISAYEDNI